MRGSMIIEYIQRGPVSKCEGLSNKWNTHLRKGKPLQWKSVYYIDIFLHDKRCQYNPALETQGCTGSIYRIEVHHKRELSEMGHRAKDGAGNKNKNKEHCSFEKNSL